MSSSDGRRVQVLSTFFPSYIFIRIELQWRTALWAPGVVRIVQSGAPVKVPDKVVDKIRKRERNGAVEPPRRRLKVGARVHRLSSSRGHGAVLAHCRAPRVRTRRRNDRPNRAD